MNSKSERFFDFIKKENTKRLFAFVFYTLFVVVFMKINLPLAVEGICFIIQMFIMLSGGVVYMDEYLDKVFKKIEGKLAKSIIQEIKKLAKEIAMFIPVLLISIFITSFMATLITIGKPANQIRVEASFYQLPILSSIDIIIIAPIIEEFIFRFLPYRFIKNKTLYIIVSTVVFAAMHVLNDPNPLYYIWIYMITPLYWGYRYHKTNDILVPIFMHSFDNLIGVLLMIL